MCFALTFHMLQRVENGLWTLYPPEPLSEEEAHLMQQQQAGSALEAQAKKVRRATLP